MPRADWGDARFALKPGWELRVGWWAAGRFMFCMWQEISRPRGRLSEPSARRTQSPGSRARAVRSTPEIFGCPRTVTRYIVHTWQNYVVTGTQY